ncbi:unnamed protein product [Debaryomyces tyrocola]|nr:unnamed protein product [Debaryomyces tyrocola]
MSCGTILVTGGTGFVGTYCLIQLLEQGYDVHTSVRDLNKEAKLREIIKANTVGYGHAERSKPFDENDFTNLEGTNATYVKSKTVAEIEAWKFVKSDANTHAQSPIALTVLNPSYIFGPPLKKSPDNSSSLKTIDFLLNGTFADGCKNLYLSAIDVRDVAKLHVLALQTPEAEGNRFILNTGENISLLDVANILAENLPAEYTKNLPTKELEGTKDTKRPSTNEKAKRVFNWEPIPLKEALLASAKGLLNI